MKVKHSLPKNAVMILSGYGINVRQMNSYQLRLNNEEERYGHFFDWYFTTGTLVENLKGENKKAGIYLDVEDLAIFINKRNQGATPFKVKQNQEIPVISEETKKLLRSINHSRFTA